MPELPTLKVKHPDGYAIINEADFVEGTHELFDTETPAQDERPSEAQIRKMNKAALIAFLATHDITADAETTNAALIELALPLAAQPE